jgi:hypothetical protein
VKSITLKPGWVATYKRHFDLKLWGLKIQRLEFVALDAQGTVQDRGGQFAEFTVSYLWALALTILLPLLWLLVRHRTRRSRRARGLCPACGYDLRATPERCPECGTIRRS